MNKISAEIIADSINADFPNRPRLTTFIVKFPRIVLSEFNTHKMLCLSGDTKLEFEVSQQNSRVAVYRLSIKEFADKWFNVAEQNIKSRLKKMKIRQLNEETNKIQTSTIKDCFISGVKDVYELETKFGNKLKCSRDHKIYTNNGWKRLKDIQVDEDLVFVKSFGEMGTEKLEPKYDLLEPMGAYHIKLVKDFSDSYGSLEQVKSITLIGKEETYDLEINGKFANFIANNIVVHNSKNSASSRAIPFIKMLENVSKNPFIPIKWMKDHKGMQGSVFFEDWETDEIKRTWLSARDAAVGHATALNNLGVTKQIVNRLLEPFLWHTVLCTATDWENFFALRAHEAAEIHIQDLAYKMLDEYNKSEPKELKSGEWHIPFGDKLEDEQIMKLLFDSEETRTKLPLRKDSRALINDVKLMISAARAARISYNNFDGVIDINKDIELAYNLLKSGHLSPFEHAGKALSEDNYQTYDCTNYVHIPEYSGNFCPGWLQYRKTFENENRKDSRVIKK